MHPATLRAFTDELNHIYGLEKDAGPIMDALKKGTVPVKKGIGMVQKAHGALGQAALKGTVHVQTKVPFGHQIIKHISGMTGEDAASMLRPIFG